MESFKRLSIEIKERKKKEYIKSLFSCEGGAFLFPVHQTCDLGEGVIKTGPFILFFFFQIAYTIRLLTLVIFFPLSLLIPKKNGYF
jgi:hypothetical protein